MARPSGNQSDEMGAHARLYDAIGLSAAWHALAFSSRALYMEMRLKLKQTNNGNIEATHAALKHAGFMSSSTVAKALRELETVGLIEKTRQGGIANGGKTCNLFRFTDKPTFERPSHGIAARPATKEWARWGSVRAAKAAIRDAHTAAVRPVASAEIATKLRSPKRTASKIEAEATDRDSISGHGDSVAIQKPKLSLVAGSSTKLLISQENSSHSAIGRR